MDLPTPDGSKSSIVHDRWDVEDLAAARREVRAFGKLRKVLGDMENGATAPEALDDVFFVLHKADPRLVGVEEMDPEYLVNRQVLAEVMATPEWLQLREFSVGEPFQAIQSALEMGPVLEGIFDRMALAQELAAQLKRVLELQDTADADVAALFGGEAEVMMADLEAQLASGAADIAADVARVVGEAAAAAAKMGASQEAWGLSPGQLQKLPAKERLRLARKLNDPRMQAIAELFGRIRNACFASSAEDVFEDAFEVVDLTFGGDLSRVVASELLGLTHDVLEIPFLARLAEQDLLSEKVQDRQEVGRGGIVMCIDGSGSMGVGDRDLWAKAVMLVLLHLAREQHREMHVIHFGYREHREYSFTRPEDFTADKIVTAATAFWASGTDFEWPMERARGLLEAEYAATGRTTADVVFATDNECYVRPEVMASYLASMREMKARTWGLLTNDYSYPGGPLELMSEGRVLSVKDLKSGRDLRSLWAGVR